MINFNEIIKITQKPELYKSGTHEMWTDPYISKQLLDIHLNPDIDLASRKESGINLTLDWMLSEFSGSGLKVLDLGCGPGLYAERLTQKGHQVTAVDFSQNSIEYARQQAQLKNLDINYINRNYLELDEDDNSYDLVILIFTDFGMLFPDDQKTLLAKVQRLLKPNGVFIFDVLNEKDIQSKTTAPNWEAATNGFWLNTPYLALSNSFLYAENKVILFQHTVFDQQMSLRCYRFWTHFFSHSDLRQLLEEAGFGRINFYENVLPGNGLWNGENVTFCRVSK